MEVYLAITPQDLLMAQDVPQSKPKGAGVVTSSTALTTSIPVPTTIQSTPVASTPPRVTRATLKKSIYPCFFSFCLFIMLFSLIFSSSFVKVVRVLHREILLRRPKL